MDYTADDFRAWMDERGLSAAAVAAGMRSEEQTIRKWRSQGVPERRKLHVERYMREWTPTAPATPAETIEDAVQRLRATDAIVITPDAERLARWDRASRKAGAETLKDWINDGLDYLAERELGSIQQAPIAMPRPQILAAAGSPIGAEVMDWNGAADTVSVRIQGLSMEPLLHDGDVITMKHKRVSRSPFMKKGLIYLVEYDGGYTVKRYNTRPAKDEEKGEEWVESGKVRILESLNPDYPEIIIKAPVEWIAWLPK